MHTRRSEPTETKRWFAHTAGSKKHSEPRPQEPSARGIHNTGNGCGHLTSPEGLHARLVTRVVWLTHLPEFKHVPSVVLYKRTSREASPLASNAPSGLKARAEMAPTARGREEGREGGKGVQHLH